MTFRAVQMAKGHRAELDGRLRPVGTELCGRVSEE
jgi:hypothetical protein